MAKAGKPPASRAKVLAKMKNIAKGAWGKAKKTEPKVKGSRLPDGLIRAVGKLSSWKLDETKDKKIPYVSISAVVMEPAEFAGTKFAKSWFIKPTKGPDGKITKTVDQKMEEMASDLQLLGVETAETSDLDSLCEKMDEKFAEGGFFYFNTWQPPGDKQRPTPDVIIMLQGVADDYSPDDTEEEAPDDEEESGDEESGDEEAGDEEEGGDEEAEEGDGEDSGDEEEAAAEEEEDWIPKKGEVYYFKANPKATKKELKITKVNEAAQTVDGKRVEDDKVFSKIPWKALSGDE